MKVVINTCYGGFGVSREALHRLRELGEETALKENYMRFHESYCDEIPRDSSLLIQVIGELCDAANGSLARLTVVDIPDGIEWEIEDYDGWEKVVEKHRSWP